ncbi:hypothetical protein [Pseudomonas faucium]|uniref:hypothetical protein n=1 Tax=Pseudomonas faucium TaxID=2740518 RepID=UPI0015969DA5|nr:hypothetical protein [Pseudomonas faucium]
MTDKLLRNSSFNGVSLIHASGIILPSTSAIHYRPRGSPEQCIGCLTVQLENAVANVQTFDVSVLCGGSKSAGQTAAANFQAIKKPGARPGFSIKAERIRP